MDLHRPDPFRDRPHSADDMVLSDAAIDALIGDLRRIGALLRPDDAPPEDPEQRQVSGESDG